MRFDDVKGKPVISVAGAKRVGIVDTGLVELSAQVLRGLKLRSGGIITEHHVLLLADVQSFGDDAVTVQSSDRVDNEEARNSLKDLPDMGAIDGARVVTEGGSEVGTVSDIEFDPSSGAIGGYILSSSLIDRFRGDHQSVPASAVHSINKGLIVVTNDALEASAGTS